MSGGGAALQPTFTGHVASTQDALVLFEACLQGHLSHVPRRPHDRERNQLIRSGCVFIYEENASGIKRWTDGVTWSPSRILGNFLVYRELDKPFPPGEKKRANRKNNRRASRPGEPYARPNSTPASYSPTTPQAATFGPERAASEQERQLIGSLIDSYGFKQDGLVKKTMSVTVQGVTHHLVSYYNVNDVINNQLRTPSQTETLQYIRPRTELVTKQSFRSPIEELDDLEGARTVGHNQFGYRLGPQGYAQPYYMPQPYQQMSHQQASSGPYSVGIPAMNHPYMQNHANGSQGQAPRHNDYNHYDQAPYSRSYESLNTNLPPTTMAKSIAPTTTTSMPPMLNDRQPQPLMYPHIPQRPMADQSAGPGDARVSYGRGNYSMGIAQSPVENHRPQQSPMNLKYEDNVSSYQPSEPLYLNPRPPSQFNPAESRPALSQGQPIHHSPYAHNPSMPSWPGTAQTAQYQH